ncbi:hypothetical protein NSK11_contig00230-0011, partial [Nocardia seriolae]
MQPARSPSPPAWSRILEIPVGFRNELVGIGGEWGVDLYERLESCDVLDGEPAMTTAEAMESLVLHHDCVTAMCERKMAAGQVIKTDAEKVVSAKVIRFPERRREPSVL